MNKVILMGRICRDPEIRTTQGGKTTARFTIAVDRRVAKADEKADFIPCVAWEKKAEFAEKYLKKGTKVAITGRIQTGSYDGKNGKVYTTDIIAEDIEFAESKKSGEKEQSNEFTSIPEGIDLPFN